MTAYPKAYDDSSTLRTVRDDVETTLAKNLSPSDAEMHLDDTSGFNPDGGYCTVYSFHDAIMPEQRASTYAYSGVGDGTLVGIRALRNGAIHRVRGCRVVSNIMADERNDLLDAIKTLQHEIGHSGTEDRESIEWFTQLLVSKVKRPRPWFKVTPGTTGFTFMPFRFRDLTSRLQAWQNIEWSWNFGDGGTSSERDPVHVYERPGRYTVTLRVTNDYGTGTLVAKNVVLVMGVAPEECDVTVDPPSAIAGETVVTMSCKPSLQSDPKNPVSKIEWAVEDGAKLIAGPLARVVFEKAGRPVARVTQRTTYGNFSVQDVPPVNVVERGSLWAVAQATFNPEASVEEFSPSTNTWKAGKASFPLRRDWSEIPNTPARDESYLFSGAMHDFVGTMSALVLHGESKESMGSGEYNGLSDTYRSAPSRPRGWGWVSARINTRSEAHEESKQTYVMFGRSDVDSLSETDLLTVEHYGMQTRTWETLPLALATEGATDSDVLQEAAASGRSNRPRRWRAVNWGNTIYIVGSGPSDLMTTFLSFKPATRTWRSLPEPALQSRSIDMDDCAMFSLAAGIYAADSRKFISSYEPEAAVWRSLSGDAIWMTSREGRVTDPSSLLKAAYRSEAPKVDHLLAFVGGFGFDGVVAFDEGSRTSTVMPYRKPGLLSAMTMF
jgi:hypothetical protein